MDYVKTAHEICDAIGGSKNVKNVSHCATRFRVVLHDDSKFDVETIEKIAGVKGTLTLGSQHQIIIGKEVADLYNAFVKEFKIEDAQGEVPEEKGKKRNILADVGSYIQGAIGPMIVPMVGAGLIKAMLTLLVTMGLITNTNSTYTMLWSCADAVMYFMPVLLAYGAAKRLACNEVMALIMALMTLNTTWTAALQAGETMTLFGITVPAYSYAQQFLPVLLTVAIYALIERLLKKYVPDILQLIIVPALSIFIMIPIIFLVIGPAMVWLSNMIAIPAAWLAESRIIAIPLLAMLWPILTLFGLHGAVYQVVYLLYFNMYGYDPVCLVSYLCTHMSIGFVALMSAIISKNKETREIGISTGITMLFGCVSEPAIFGVLMKDKRMFAATLSAAFVSGIYAALSGIKNTVLGGAASLLGIPFFIGEGSSLINVLITIIIAAVGSAFFVLLYTGVFSKEKKAQRK